MNSNQPLSLDQPPAKGPATHNRARLFYSGTAALLLILAFLGFQQFYLHGKAYPGRELTPAIRTLVILHGIATSAWMLLFIVQPLLVVTGNRRVHVVLGRFGTVLAGCIVLLGLQVAIASARITPPETKIFGE